MIIILGDIDKYWLHLDNERKIIRAHYIFYDFIIIIVAAIGIILFLNLQTLSLSSIS